LGEREIELNVEPDDVKNREDLREFAAPTPVPKGNERPEAEIVLPCGQ
jgi:hypothetical protein